jgi:hypothetical protein
MITEEKAHTRSFEDDESWSLRSPRRAPRATSKEGRPSRRRLLLLLVLLLIVLGGAYVARERILHSGNASLGQVAARPLATRTAQGRLIAPRVATPGTVATFSLL